MLIEWVERAGCFTHQSQRSEIVIQRVSHDDSFRGDQSA